VKRASKKLLAILIVSTILLAIIPLNASAIPATVDILPTDSVGGPLGVKDKIDTALGLANPGDTITVTGSNSNASTILKFDIPTGVTVIWQATYRGTANPVIDIGGVGTFEVASGGWIQNTSSANSFTAIRANNSEVIVSGGTVQAGKGRAIEGAGPGTTVTVTGSGTVFNTATNNLFPCIDMTNASNTGLNVIVEANAKVFSDPDPAGATTVYGYAIQTYGDVLISGGKVYTTGPNGRGINLVGANSNAKVTGGDVYATGLNGVAISTSTTNPGQVTNASVTVEGGLVAAYGSGNSWAVRTTGANSAVSVTGGCVFAYGNNSAFIGTSLTSVPSGAVNSVIFIQGRTGGFTAPTTNGVVIAWDRNSWNTPTHSRAPYNERARRHILTDPEQKETQLTPPAALVSPYAVWSKAPSGYNDDGILYNFGPGNSGFIPLPEVEVSAVRSVRIAAGPSGQIGGAVALPSRTPYPTVGQWGGLIDNVPFNSDIEFTFIPDYGYSVAYIDIKNSTTGESIRSYDNYGLNTYTLRNIRHDYVVVVFFVKPLPNQHTIVSFAGSGGTIVDPDTGPPPVHVPLVNVLDGTSNLKREITAEAGHHIVDIRVDGKSVLGSGDLVMDTARTLATYTFPTITRNSVISVTFEHNEHKITASAGPNGSITPFGDEPITNPEIREIPVADGGSRAFTIVPATGFYIDSLLINKNPVPPRSVYEFTNVTDDCEIEVTFAMLDYDTYKITATADSGGSIFPNGLVEVTADGDQSFVITPDPGWEIDDLSVDGSSVIIPLSGIHTFEKVNDDHTIDVTFERLHYVITARADNGGSIVPDENIISLLGIVPVDYGDDQTFTITPDDGWYIERIWVDDQERAGPGIPPATSHTFVNVTTDRTIDVAFARFSYTITATADANGSISPSGAVSVYWGENQSFTITPDPGFQIKNVLVNGSSVGTGDSYTFPNVTESQTIHVEFEEIPDSPPPPGRPSSSGRPGTHENGTTPPVGKSPQTGDNRSVILPITLLAVGLLVISGAELLRRYLKRNIK
jgi:hypothetical protein